jgi:hypothetical protein
MWNLFPKAALLMPEIVAASPDPSCFPEAESRNFNRLVLIPFCLARDAHGRFAGEALATRAAGAYPVVRDPAPRTMRAPAGL